jgi:GNAT superfamily N-acetyltransferase
MDQIEQLELRALEGWYDAAAAAKLAAFDWRLVEIGDAVCSVSSSEPSILINRVLGLGSQHVPTHDRLVEIRRLYREANVPRFFLHMIPERAGPTRGELLTAAGYVRHRGWMKFVRGPGALPEPRTRLEIRQIGNDHIADFAAVVASAFDLHPESERALMTLIDAPGWHLFMSFDDDHPAGTGGLFVHEGCGYLDWGATDPDYRRRGSQSAILRARLERAFDLGCEKIVTMTGEAVPGDPQHSYSNILRAGFSEAYLRENWIPSAD